MKKIFNQVANFIKTNRAISAAIAVVIITVAIGIGFIVANLGNSQNGSGAPDPSNPGYTDPPATSHQHLYAAETIQASCGHGGCTLYTCECGHSYTEDETPALEHELSDWVVTQEPTPENEGQKEQRCLHCNHRIVETIPKLEKHEHTFDDKVVKPTCSEKGYTSHTCSTCSYKYSDNHTSALGHSWSAWAETGKTSDAGMIEVSRSCKNCKKPKPISSPNSPRLILTPGPKLWSLPLVRRMVIHSIFVNAARVIRVIPSARQATCTVLGSLPFNRLLPLLVRRSVRVRSVAMS